jgi:hypothetical protein
MFHPLIELLLKGYGVAVSLHFPDRRDKSVHTIRHKRPTTRDCSTGGVAAIAGRSGFDALHLLDMRVSARERARSAHGCS